MLPSLITSSRPACDRFWVFLFCLVFILGISNSVTPAREGGIRPYSMPQNLLEYFQGKYATVDTLEVRIQQTSDGPLGQLDLTGAIVMSVDVTGMTPEDAARAVAAAFLAEEAAVLDIPSPADMHETSLAVSTEGGITAIQYARYIGQLPFVDVSIRIEVNESYAITHVEATLAPVSAALTSAVGQTTLTSEDVKTIVRNDLVRSNQPVEPTVPDPTLVATWRSPYVVWGVTGSVGEKPAWGYKIDAFTGEILNKTCTVVPVRDTTGGTSCD